MNKIRVFGTLVFLGLFFNANSAFAILEDDQTETKEINKNIISPNERLGI